MEREAELVEQAGQRGGDWHDAFYHRMAMVEERIEEAERRWTEHAGQMRMDLARRWALAEEEAAMELEARAVEAEARRQRRGWRRQRRETGWWRPWR